MSVSYVADMKRRICCVFASLSLCFPGNLKATRAAEVFHIGREVSQSTDTLSLSVLKCILQVHLYGSV